jgi:hypothetical protein
MWHSWYGEFMKKNYCINLWSHLDKANFELKSMQIWLGQNFTYFYVHNFSEEWILLVPNPTIGLNNNVIIYR